MYTSAARQKSKSEKRPISLLTFLAIELRLSFSVAVEYRGIHFEEARPTIDWASLRRVERHGRGLTALRAVHRYLDTLSDTRRLGRSDRRKPFILGLLTFLATLGWILKFLIAEESLFSDRPNEIDPAVDAKDRLVVKF
jgi:hypothetical protein